MYLAKIRVTLKPTVNDPQGLTIKGALQSLDFKEVSRVRAGKYIEAWVDGPDRREVERRVEDMCRKLLSNPVIEDFRFELEELKP